MVAGFLNELALNYYQVGNFKEALHEANKALILEPSNKEALGLIEKIKSEQKELERAIKPETPAEIERQKAEQKARKE